MSTSAPRDTPAIEPVPHEFDTRQDQIIRDLSRSMRWVALPLLFIGVLYAVTAVMGVIQAFARPETLLSVVFVVLAMVFFFSLGVWTRRAADSFDRITTSHGQDIAHLMDGLDNLRKKYSVLSLLVKVYVFFVVVVLVVMLVAIMAGAFTA